ncbi:ABC transporter permease subunit [Shinella curvata]|uniref:ABC transporter permease subunit n=1 Tax=Shinella curvata TaxID=1817964 RepID=A0ABT8XLA1_9HYPH|nr:ABC transporter permease subunit [Shinella curvata]MCJ8056675.1 ABC transporter permease subunit [Shinella curvata]MDO6124485.1 ABC transporter permease subunit [Shinella curvata]
MPATAWIGSGLTAAFEFLKPAARLAAKLLEYPMAGANRLLVGAPYALTIGVLAALGWHIGGRRMLALVLAGLGFILASGYWIASMNTLALVVVSVPLALALGGLIGVFAYEFLSFRRTVETVLDIMQTVPTFAYLTPLLLLFGFGPVVGLIASVIYAAPPMARNVLLGLQRVEPDIREAAIMNGATRIQQLVLVEIPSATQQIMVGVNQTIMAALSMVIIAAVIGGFNDIGWEVLLTMRKAAFGQSLIAGVVIVIFAVLADRMSSGLAKESKRHSWRITVAILLTGIIVAALQGSLLPAANDFAMFKGATSVIDRYLGAFTAANGALLEGIKNTTMFFVLLPLRIGLDEAVLPFTWGFQWTNGISIAVFGITSVAALVLGMRNRAVAGLSLLVATGILVTGIANLPWPFVLVALGGLGWLAGGPKLSAFAVLMVSVVLLMGLWEPALLSLYLCAASVLICVVVGGAIGLACAVSENAWRVMRPVCDFLQTIPLFVFLIPVLMFFQIGEFSAFLAICAYAIVPMIRYTQHGLTSTPEELIEAAVSSGANEWQVMREVRIPYSAPTILLGLNQTILYAFSMLVIAALIGTTDLGQQIYLALGQGDVGLGVAAGASMAILALVADRLIQGFAARQRHALGL